MRKSDLTSPGKNWLDENAGSAIMGFMLGLWVLGWALSYVH